MKKPSHLHNTLEKLHAYTPSSGHIFSLYIENLSGESGDALAQVVRKLIRTSLPKDAQRTCAKEIALVLAYLTADYDSHHHLSHIAFFAGNSLWEIIHHTFPIKNACFISHAPNTRLIDNELRKNGRYLFVVADREKANLFTFYKGKIETYRNIFDPSVPQKVKANKGEYFARNDIILRHIENHLHRHLQTISDAVDTFMEAKPVEAVFVGGHKVLFHDIKRHLNPSYQHKFGGDFVTELNIPKAEMLKHAEKTLETYLITHEGVSREN